MGPDWIDPAIVPMPWSDPEASELRSLRIAFHTDNGMATPTPETIAAVAAVSGALNRAGACVSEERPVGVEETFDVGLPIYIWDGGARSRMSRILEKHDALLCPVNARTRRRGARHREVRRERARRLRPASARKS